METDIHFMKEVVISGIPYAVLRRKNMSPAAQARYGRIQRAKMFYTKTGRIIIRFKRNDKIVYHLLSTIDDAIRQQKHIIEKHKEAGLPPRTTNSEHRFEVLLEEKTNMEELIKSSLKIINAIKKEIEEKSPDFKKIKNLLYFFDLAISGLWVNPYFNFAVKLEMFISPAYVAAGKNDSINLKKNIRIIESHLIEYEYLI